MANKIEGINLDDGTEGSTVGFRGIGSTYGRGDAEEVSETKEVEEEPEEETEEEEEEEEVEEEESEEEDEETELDEDGLPKKVSPELEAERKALHRAYSNKMKGMADLRLKANLVDQIISNPEQAIHQLAEHYGVKLADEGQTATEEEPTLDFDFDPKEDEKLPDYIKRVFQGGFQALAKQQGKLQSQKREPVARTPQQRPAITEEDVRRTMDTLENKYDDWGLYEEAMVKLVQQHPTLGKDPDRLYRMAKEDTVALASKATTKKNKQGKKKTTSSGARRKAKGKLTISTSKGKKMSFDEAWDRAKQDVAGGSR